MTSPRESVHAPGLARFVAFHEAPEASFFRGETLAFAVMLARAPDGFVLVFNNFRRVWELPGGLIDAGERPRDAAIRELREEAGCDARDVRWLGVTEVTDGRAHFGAVCGCHVSTIEFGESEEIGALAYWKPARAPADIGDTDEALLARFGT
jgi:8-oxo-dGTP diphosphatase